MLNVMSKISMDENDCKVLLKKYQTLIRVGKNFFNRSFFNPVNN